MTAMFYCNFVCTDCSPGVMPNLKYRARN